MGFDIRIVTECWKLSKKQIREILITIILPVAAAVAFIAPLWPSLITDARTLNICLLGFIVALPVVLINNVVWSVLTVASVGKLHRILTTSFLLSAPGLKNNELVREEMRSALDEMFDKAPFCDDMLSEAMISFQFRDIASVLTAIAFYVTAIIICLFTPGTLISALLFLVIASLPPICAMVLMNKMFSKLQAKLSTMTHHEIIDQVGQFVLRHFSPDLIRQMESYLYVLLGGDRNTSLSEILDSRMKIADSVLVGKLEKARDSPQVTIESLPDGQGSSKDGRCPLSLI